jgi:hypothetical protein
METLEQIALGWLYALGILGGLFFLILLSLAVGGMFYMLGDVLLLFLTGHDIQETKARRKAKKACSTPGAERTDNTGTT